MRELDDILEAFERLGSEEVGVLASIVGVAGSTYRRVGARLFVGPDDELIGLLSGGCLEGDLLAHARAVRADGSPRELRYDSTTDDDIVWGLGLGCAGVVEVLLEPVTRERPGPLRWLAKWRRARETGVLATARMPRAAVRRWALHLDGPSLDGPMLDGPIVEGPMLDGPKGGEGRGEPGGELGPEPGPEPGPELGPERDGESEAGASGGGAFEAAPSRELREAMLAAARTGRARALVTREGPVLVEVVRPPRRLVVFGAGRDAEPVARIARELGWDVELVDHRPAYARSERFPGARVHLARAEDALQRVPMDADSYALIMTHHYEVDRELLCALLPSAVPYIGLLGPKQRALDLLADLAARGIEISDEQRARLHGPAGLDIGGEGPEAIALSLLAEISAVAEGRPGGWLRDRKGPIHEPEAT